MNGHFGTTDAPYPGHLRVESVVPYGEHLHTWLYLSDADLVALAPHGHIEQHYLAWETVRLATNPFFERGTGFEGYFVGCVPGADAALAHILALCQRSLEDIGRLYRFEYGFRGRLMKTLVREMSDIRAIHVWSETLGAALARLRAQVTRCDTAERFRDATYLAIKSLPPIDYRVNEHTVLQRYRIAGPAVPLHGRANVTLQSLPASQQDAWLVAMNIGEFGHPLVRHLLDRVPPM